jgi:RNA polymerase sigma-70 factor (ECF subfamily)
MDSTSPSLLERLRQPGQPEAWNRFVELYTPLLLYWARRLGLQPHDAADLVQDVFTALVQKLPDFAYDPRKTFRGWLRKVVHNKWHDRQRRRNLPVASPAEGHLSDVVGPDGLDAFWDGEHRQHLVRRALELMQAEFEPKTWKACWEFVVAEKSAAEVAGELGMTVHAVHVAKWRVLRRLRQELAGLLD